MKSEVVDVNVEGKKIGTAEVPIFDSVEEAIEHFSPEKVLKLINRSAKADSCNKVRMAHLNDTPERSIARIARDAKRGKIDKSEAARQITALCSQLVA